MATFVTNTLLIESMDILTKAISPLFSLRVKQIEKFRTKAEEIQAGQLSRLLEKGRHTVWGKQHHFGNIHSYNDFTKQIPLHTYDDLKPCINRMINGEDNILWPGKVTWYAQSSGTTNDKSKFIPVTHDILHKCHYQGGFDSVALYLHTNPNSHFFSRKGLILGGSHAPSPLNASVRCGDLSAVLLQNLNPLVNLIRVPRKEIILMNEWESKIKAIVDNTWNKDVNSLSGVPSWMLVLIKALLKKTGKQYLTDVWPNLEVFFHGGISFDPYREQYRSLIPSDQMHYQETYNASEGFFGIQDDPDNHSMLLMLDYGIFYEFVPLDQLDKEQPMTLPIEAVETDVNYALAISTQGGLWRYLIGDTIRFTSLKPYKFIISGRTKHFINAFGEELMVGNADKALSKACQQTGAVIREYTAAPLFLLEKAKGRHQWLIEFEQQPHSLDAFASILDQALKEVNSDYEAKRYKEISLQPLEVIAAREGTFYQWLKQKGKLGGQHKIPRLSNNRNYLEELLQISNQL